MLKNLESKLFFLVILFLPTQFGKHFWPSFSYIYSLKIDYLSPTFYFWDFLVLVLGIIWVVGVIRGFKVNMLAITLALIFLLSQVLSLINASNVGGGLVRLWQFFVAVVFGLYIASNSWEFIRKPLYRGLLLAVFFESVLAIYQFFAGRDLGLWILGERSFSLSTPMIATFNFYGQVFLRPYGTTSHPNVLGAFFVISIPLLAFIARRNFANVLVMVLGMLASLLTFSRGAILILSAENFFILRNKFRIFIIAILVLLPILYVRFDSAFNFDSLSILRREELAGFAIDQFKISPLAGIGLNNFINQIASSSLVSGPNRFLQPVHNIFLLTLAETGVLGLLGLLGLFVFPAVVLITKKTLIASLFLIIIFLGSFDHYFLTLPQGQRLFFLIWGLSMLEWMSGSFKKDI